MFIFNVIFWFLSLLNQTGSRLRNTENGGWFKNVTYYDRAANRDKNRTLQVKSLNHLGGVNQIDYQYNFIGEVLKERIVYRRSGAADVTTLTEYDRDNAGRVLQTWHSINGKKRNLAVYEYDELGRLKRKKLASASAATITRTATPPNNTQDLASQWVQLLPGFSITPSSTNSYLACVQPREALQIIDYSYHIRGSVNCINCVNGVPTLNVSEGDLFAMKLEHEEDGRFYNGLISKQSWVAPPAPDGGASIQRSFVYDYDNLNRFKSAAYTGVGAENFSVNNINYDQNGNIQTLQRYGKNGGGYSLIDNLTYNYGTSHNQLTGITDAAYNTNGFIEAPLGGLGAYEYWIDGSLKKDLNKGITEITYNYLRLPQKVTFTDGRWVEYYYDAEGDKYKQLQSDGKEYHYVGDILYVKLNASDALKTYQIGHDEGRIVSDGTNLVYEYAYHDHLGNLRVSFVDSLGVAVISQQNDYDPWGLALVGIDRASRFANANFYGFNGQEQLEAGYQNMGWRWYDRTTGRMTGIDPMNQFASGYVGLGNNPVSLTDPDGRFVQYLIGAVIGGFSGYSIGKSHGAKGWQLAGYTLAGAGIGAISVGAGEAVLGSFGYAAQAGVGAGSSMAAYGASGAAGGFVSGAGFAGLSGNNVWEGGFKGALIGAATGALGGYLKHEAFDNAIHKNLIAQTGPGDDGVMMRYLGNNTFASPTALDAALVIGSRYSPYVSVAQKSWQLGQLIGNNIELFASSIANILISMGVNERVLVDPNYSNSKEKPFLYTKGGKQNIWDDQVSPLPDSDLKALENEAKRSKNSKLQQKIKTEWKRRGDANKQKRQSRGF